jgi:hypothetical protein
MDSTTLLTAHGVSRANRSGLPGAIHRSPSSGRNPGLRRRVSDDKDVSSVRGTASRRLPSPSRRQIAGKRRAPVKVER